MFTTVADEAIAGWREAQSRKLAGGPNECRLGMGWSCREALREIGLEGPKLPGLIKPAK